MYVCIVCVCFYLCVNFYVHVCLCAFVHVCVCTGINICACVFVLDFCVHVYILVC